MRIKTAVTTDCTCDLSDELLEKYGIGMIFFYIYTETGRFRDRDEITANNVLEHMAKGGKTETGAPPPDEYVSFFREKLKNAEEIVHITISSGISLSYENSLKAKEALGDDGKRIHIVDSKHLSSGVGFIVLKAAKMAAERKDAKYIAEEAEKMSNRVSSTFIVRNADYLYKNGKVGKWVQRLCNLLNIHPVLGMKDGNISVKRIFFGNYENAQLKYIRKELINHDNIDKKRLFITHAGCSIKELNAVRREIDKYCTFENTSTTTASATISSNCGPHTIGVLYINKR